MAYPLIDQTAFIDSGRQGLNLYVNNVLTITEADIVSGSFNLDRYSSSAVAMELGNVTAAQLTFTLDLSISESTLQKGDKITGEIYLVSDSTVKVEIGTFYIVQMDKGFNSLTITCLDSMILLDAPASYNVSFPITATNFLNALFPNETIEIDSGVYNATLYRPVTDTTLTYRQVLSKICEVMGANAYYDWNGSLHIGWYGRSSLVELGQDKRVSSVVTENSFSITAVEITDTDEAGVEIDGDEITLRIVRNPFMTIATQSQRETIEAQILSNVGGVDYYGASATVLSMVGLYPMDTVDFGDKLIPITHVTIGLNSDTNISGDISSDNNSYNYDFQRDINKAIDTADEAQATADEAQATADEAQSTAEEATATSTTALNRATAHYGVSTTKASTKAKTASISDFSLYEGATVTVKFNYTNTATAPTLNVNGTGAYPITAFGEELNADSPYTWEAGATLDLVYDGSNWEIIDAQALKKVSDLDEELNAEGTFNRLTNNGEIQGIQWDNNQIYINGEYIQANTLSGNKVYGGVVTGRNGHLVIDLDNDVIYYDGASLQDEIDNLQEQIDGNQSSWSGQGVPTLNNYPAEDWTTDAEKNRHIGNMYFDTDTGYAYRFVDNNGTYMWQRISDSDVTLALEQSQQALNIASNDLYFMTPHTWNQAHTVASFEAKVYRGLADVTEEFPDSFFVWYLRNEDNVTETQIAIGKTCTVNMSDLGYGSTVIGQFTTYESAYLTDKSGNKLTTKNGTYLTQYVIL